MDVLANKDFSEKGGADLGLIEIARKSGQKIEFVFDKFKDNHSIFYNQITLQTKKEVKQGRYISEFYIDEAMKFHRKMLEHHIFMIQKGDFPHSSKYQQVCNGEKWQKRWYISDKAKRKSFCDKCRQFCRKKSQTNFLHHKCNGLS